MKWLCLLLPMVLLLANIQAGEEQIKPPAKEFTDGIGMKFVWIPPGHFLMGSPKQEEGREEETQHKVTFTKGFYLGVYTVTQAQWEKVMNNNPSFHNGNKNLPVETVSWEDCQTFLEKLSKREGKVYRLPTESEWEYGCRAGTTTPFHFGENITSHSQANFNGNLPYGKSRGGLALQKTTPVGSYPANPWGLYDMHGNVWQWCADRYDDYPEKAVVDPPGEKETPPQVPGLIKQLSSAIYAERQAASQALKEIGYPALASLRKTALAPPDLETQRRVDQLVQMLAVQDKYRVLRGGSFRSPAALVRSANRSGMEPKSRTFDVGFRAVRTLENVAGKNTK
jgi:formylglycine-generating enzyme